MEIVNFDLRKKKFISELTNANYWCRQIISYNMKLEEVATKLYYVGAVDNTQIRLENKVYEPPLSLMLEEERLVRERGRAVGEINRLREILNELPKNIKDNLISMYVVGRNHERLAESMYMSKSSLYYEIEKHLKEIL